MLTNTATKAEAILLQEHLLMQREQPRPSHAAFQPPSQVRPIQQRHHHPDLCLASSSPALPAVLHMLHMIPTPSSQLML